jgi:hypothetical protein
MHSSGLVPFKSQTDALSPVGRLAPSFARFSLQKAALGKLMMFAAAITTWSRVRISTNVNASFSDCAKARRRDTVPLLRSDDSAQRAPEQLLTGDEPVPAIEETARRRTSWARSAIFDFR